VARAHRLALLLGACLACGSAWGQEPPRYFELWPELNGYLRFNQNFRALVQVSPVFIPGHGYSEMTVSAFIDFFMLPLLYNAVTKDDSKERLLSLRLGAVYIQSVDSGDLDPVQHFMLPFEAQARYRLPFKMLLSLRNRVELRWRFLDDPVLVFRYRLRGQIEQEVKIGESALTPYINSELFCSTPGWTVPQVRFQGGVVFDTNLFARGQAVELYYLYILDPREGKPDSHVLGLALHFYF
jgi:hypothetical protein